MSRGSVSSTAQNFAKYRIDCFSFSNRRVIALIFEWIVLLLTPSVGRRESPIEVFPEVIGKALRTAIQTCSVLGLWLLALITLYLIAEKINYSPRRRLEPTQQSLGMRKTSFLRCVGTRMSVSGGHLKSISAKLGHTL